MSCKLMTTTLKFLNLLLAGKTTEKGEEIYIRFETLFL